MSEFLDAQPVEYRDQVEDLLGREAVNMAVMLHLDFASNPVRLSNRNIPFSDLKWGHIWDSGSQLLVGLPDVTGGDNELAPFREYSLGLPDDWIDSATWRADLVGLVADRGDYANRDAALYGQLFDPDTNQPAGHPFAFDVGLMDRMTVSFPRGGAILTLTAESFLSRKGVPVYGMLTDFDQQNRHPTDFGLQFVVEAGNLITWTNW